MLVVCRSSSFSRNSDEKFQLFARSGGEFNPDRRLRLAPQESPADPFPFYEMGSEVERTISSSPMKSKLATEPFITTEPLLAPMTDAAERVPTLPPWRR